MSFLDAKDQRHQKKLALDDGDMCIMCIFWYGLNRPRIKAGHSPMTAVGLFCIAQTYPFIQVVMDDHVFNAPRSPIRVFLYAEYQIVLETLQRFIDSNRDMTVVSTGVGPGFLNEPASDSRPTHLHVSGRSCLRFEK